MRKVKIASFLIIILAYAMPGMAQKLPDVQQTAVTTTTPLKVDGKLTEPNLTFSAFNKNTRLFYTMMNDNNNLYLVMKTDETDNIRKILMGGITLSFNTSGKKKEKDAASITFPVIAAPVRGARRRGQGTFEHRIETPGLDRTKPDSAAITKMRKKQLASFNEIKVSGIDIPDTLLSIYNIYGIKTAINYDEKGNLVYEFSIPLKLLNLDSDKPKEFAYNIKVNGRPLPPPPFASRNEEHGVSGSGPRPGMGQRIIVMDGASFDPSMLEPTDFWGKYTIIKQ